MPGLNVLSRIRAARDEGEASPALAERDLAALQCLKQVLRGLVWAEEALDEPPVPFPVFFQELVGAVEAAFYSLPRHPDREEILVADAVAARGVPFRSVAVLGLAEGFFPAPQSEDPLLHDADREALELPLEPSTRSAEAEYFYETVAAPSERLLLTRPRLTDDGAPWQASPFWEEVRRLVDVEPVVPSGTSGPPPHRAASWPELLQTACAAPENDHLWTWLGERAPDAVAALDAAAQVLTWRRNRADSPFDGGLHALADHFAERFDAAYTWSASRLEAYRTCPFYFFVGKVLGLEPREEPTEGVDWLQRGIIYHDILERVYRAVDDPTDLDQLLTALPAVAAAVLDEAPERQGFRRTAWWAQTRREIVEHVRGSLEALTDDELCGDFVPLRYEAAFGLWGEPPLVVRDPGEDDRFVLRGLIDRVDRDAAGRLRVIDYKTAGPSSYRDSALRDGEKIQLPLYALAARDALGLGEPRSGFYWHVRHAEPSPLKLEDFGPREAIDTALAHAWEAIRGARAGRFVPQAARGGCPSYCPAAGFCWHYEPRYRG
ncbi:MAG: PD-(D/E)XK nuclease family protein [Planctomycetota bacterium]